VLIDWFTVGAQAINFLILVWLMKRFLYKPVLAAIDAREKKIAVELQQAADAKTQAEKEREDLRVQTEALQAKREELLREATADANVQRQHLLEDARKESEQLRSKSMTALTAEQAGLKLEVVSRTRQEAFALSRKILADLADTHLEDRMLEVFIRRVTDLKDAEKARLVAPPAGPHRGVAVLRSAFELTPVQRANIATAFEKWPCQGSTLQFETAAGLISGLELVVDGQKLAWNATDYLAAVEEKAQEPAAAQEPPAAAQDPPIPGTDVKHAA
jgi:F-type H+-transporting ATPase subunit b